MSLSCYETVERRVWNEGTDFGTTGFVILRHGQIRVVWRPGSTDWSGIGSRSYYPAKLMVEAMPSKYGGRTHTRVLEGGRLTNSRWFSVREKISELLKVPVKKIPELLPDRTLEIKK